MKKVICRPYNQGDETGILALYRDVFNLHLAPEAWRWFYEQMPDGPAVIVVAENGEGIVGHYAVQPRPFMLCGVPCLSGLAVGTMVHPSSRNLTTLVEMAHLAYDLCRRRGLSFLYAFPNDSAWRVRQAVLGWQPLPQMVEWEIPLPPQTRVPNPQTPVKRIFSADDLDCLSLPFEAESSDAICGRRTLAWLRWRFLEKPDAEYAVYVAGPLSNVRGYAALKTYVRDGILYGHIVDWQVGAEDMSAANDLFVSVRQQFAVWEVERISFWALPKSSLFRQLQGVSVRATGRKTNFGYLNLLSDCGAALADSGIWNVYMADSDVY